MAIAHSVPSLTNLVIIGAFLKLLLFPAYLSTDFDVHRNWLAITHNLPLSEWYHEATSEWTLDYPPFFAYFEWILSQFVPQSVSQDGCLDIVREDGHYGWPTIVFQRLTVMITELVLALSLRGLNFLVVALLWLNPGWIILDHIHFQYNAAMFGILIVSIRAMTAKRYLKSAFLFATLLCFKHIYLYVAPAYFVYLLKQYIFMRAPEAPKFTLGQCLARAVKLGSITIAPFILAFGPVFAADPEGLSPVLSRLFPFSRGLTHAYWAPNFWALYSAADRVLGVINKNAVESATRGIVGQISFANLPEIEPRKTFLITAAISLVSTLSGTSNQFIETVTLCGFSSFLFGWHVHEKAVMTVLVPFTLMVTKSPAHARAFAPLLVSSCFSLFPLIYTPNETVLKTVYTMAFLGTALSCIPHVFTGIVGRLNFLYSFLFVLVVMPLSAALPTLAPHYEFAGLMLISVYASIGVFWSWIQLVAIYIRDQISV